MWEIGTLRFPYCTLFSPVLTQRKDHFYTPLPLLPSALLWLPIREAFYEIQTEYGYFLNENVGKLHIYGGP